MKKILLLFVCLCLISITAFGQYDYFAEELAKAKAGDVMAMLGVGDHYRYGSGQDYSKAVEWYGKAANKGQTRAMLEMGYAYEEGNGVVQNYKKARDWYEKAAKEKDSSGQALFRIGLMYYRGRGTNVNKNEAERYFLKAANLGNKSAQEWLDKISEDKNTVGQNDNQDDLLPKAEAGDINAMVHLGMMYLTGKNHLTGKDAVQSDDDAIMWLRKAVDKGEPTGIAHFFLGLMIENGHGAAPDDAEAFKLYLKSAEKGCANGMTNLGLMYEKGHGVPQDYTEALRWYKKAAEQDYRAPFLIGRMYENGFGVQPNMTEALSWYRKGASKGDDDAQARLKTLGELAKNNLSEQQSNQRITANSDRIPDVDKNIPQNNHNTHNTFTIIIGNEKYSEEANVPYAVNDARVFMVYCKQTLGISENHIRYIANAGYNDMRKAVNWLRQGLEAYGGEGNVIFYYAGHGIPDEAQKSAYLLPVDGIGSDVGSAYSLEKLYQVLGDMPAKSIIVFLDACFSGAKRDGGMMASARGVAIKTKAEEPKGNMVVFSAAQGDETAYPYKSQQHGMFTYYLLRKLQETKGDVTLGELADYITREVKRQSFDENSRSQTPMVNASTRIVNSWRNLKLK